LRSASGFSLIELLVGVVLLGVLMAIGIPAFTDGLRNARVRTVASSVLQGLQLTRAEAVRRNTTVRFQFVTTLANNCAPSAAGPNWVVSLDDATGRCAAAASDTVAPRLIQARSGAEGSAFTTLAAGQPAFVFNSRGRLTTPPALIDLSANAGEACVDAGGRVRCLRIVVTAGGQIRMCDPALPAGDTQACT